MAQASEGFSGCDVVSLAREAAMRPVREMLARIESGGGGSLAKGKVQGPAQVKVSKEDFDKALAQCKPTALHLASKYAEFTACYG